jgi:outer membrane lipoprotein-sorting protein
MALNLAGFGLQDRPMNSFAQTYLPRITSFFLALCLLFMAQPSALQAAKRDNPPALELTKEERAEVKRINAYLNKIVHLEGDFVQIGPDGQVSEGHFYLRRPGRMRFSYNPPNPILVVADGLWIGITNSRLKTTDRIPIRATPIWALVEKRVDLMKSSRIVEIDLEPELRTLTIEDAKGKARGQLTLIFQGEPMELKQWIVKDPQGLITTVSLSNLVKNKPANISLFTIKDIKPKRRGSVLGDDR